MAIAGNDISIANSSSASNAITFNPSIAVLLGSTGANPTTYAPATSSTSSPASTSQPETNSLPFGGASNPLASLGLGTAGYPGGILSPGVSPTAVNPNAVGLTTNSTTMMWLILGGGIALMMLTAPQHGRGR